MATDITVPSLGESVSEAEIGQWLKQPGEAVEQDEPVAELETDKVTLEVNAPAAGVLSEVVAQAGETVAVGSVIGRVGEAAAGGAQADGGTSAGAPTPEKTEAPAEPAAAPAESGGQVHDVAVPKTYEVTVPTLGESVSEATLGQWLKQPGEAVQQDESIAELETDKVTLEVNAPAAGTLDEQLVAAGDTVQVGSVVARVREGAGGAAETPAKAAAPAAAESAPASGEAAPATTGAPAGGVNPNQAPSTGGTITRADLERFLGTGPNTVAPEDLSPAVRTLVQEHDLDPTRIPPSGPGGRITKQDVLDVVDGRTELLAPTAPSQATAPQQPAQSAATAREAASEGGGEAAKPVERVRMTRLRQTIAKRLKEAQDTAAMLSTFNEIDMSAVNDIRARYKDDFEKAHGTRLGMTCFFAKAVVQALKELPALNASIDGEEIVYHHYHDIGMAVSTPSGLMVPVVRDVDQKSMAGIEAELRELAKKGRDNKLSMDDLQGATFSMTNGGVFGSLLSTPILNPPQSGILGMHAIKDRPVAVNGQVEIRPMMYVALSYDHRLVDGREAVTFLVRLKECLEDPARLLLQM